MCAGRDMGIKVNPLVLLNTDLSAKMRTYKENIQDEGSLSLFIPVLISTLCGWHPEAFRMVRKPAENVTIK